MLEQGVPLGQAVPSDRVGEQVLLKPLPPPTEEFLAKAGPFIRERLQGPAEAGEVEGTFGGLVKFRRRGWKYTGPESVLGKPEDRPKAVQALDALRTSMRDQDGRLLGRLLRSSATRPHKDRPKLLDAFNAAIGGAKSVVLVAGNQSELDEVRLELKPAARAQALRDIDGDEVIKAALLDWVIKTALLGWRSRPQVVSWSAPVRLDDDNRERIPELPIALASELQQDQSHLVAYLLPGVFRLPIEQQQAMFRALPDLLGLHYVDPQHLDPAAVTLRMPSAGTA